MRYVCQKPGRFSGRDYVPGEPVPAEVVESDRGFLIGRGYVATVPDEVAGDARVSELEARVAELEAREARLAESEARVRSMAARLSEPAAAPAPAAKKAAGRKSARGSTE